MYRAFYEGEILKELIEGEAYSGRQIAGFIMDQKKVNIITKSPVTFNPNDEEEGKYMVSEIKEYYLICKNNNGFTMQPEKTIYYFIK